MKSIRVPTLTLEQLDALERLYRTTRNVRLRTRAQMVLEFPASAGTFTLRDAYLF